MTAPGSPAFELVIGGNAVDSSIVESLSVTQQPGTFDVCEVVLDGASEKRWFHRLGQPVVARLGYVAASYRAFDGEVTSVARTIDSAEASTVSVVAHNRLHRLHKTPKTRLFDEHETLDGVAGKMAHEVGLTWGFTGLPIRGLCQQQQTDFEFLMTYAAQGGGYEPYAEGRDVYLLPRRHGREDYRLTWGGAAVDLNAGEVALERFSVTVDILHKIDAVRVQAPPGKISPGRARLVTARAAGKGTRSAWPDSELTIVDHPVMDSDEATRLAEGVLAERSRGLITGQARCAWAPMIRAGRVVSVAGVGDDLAGDYLVSKANHLVTKSGFATSLEVRGEETRG